MHSLAFGGWQLTWHERDLDSFISFPFHGEMGPKELVRLLAEKGWGASCEKHEVSNATMLGHIFGEAVGLTAAAETPCFTSAGSWTLLTSTFLSDECSSSSSVAGRICHASKGSFSDGSPHTSISGHASGMGAQALAWNTSLDWEFLCGWNFPCTYPLPYCSEWEARQLFVWKKYWLSKET